MEALWLISLLTINTKVGLQKGSKRLLINKMTDTTKKIIAKSPKFPGVSLEAAVKVIQEASNHGEKFKRETFATFGAKRSDSKSFKSGAFLRRIAALKYFGLIETKGDEIEFTELAKKILAPKNDEERKETITQSFLGPPLFQKLYNSTSKDVPIKREDLGNIAVREYGITLKARKNFLNSFISSGIYAGLLKIKENDKSSVFLIDLDMVTRDSKVQTVESEEALKEKEMKEIREGWHVIVNEKDEVGNYHLQFKSKNRISETLWKQLNSFIEAIEKEFKPEKKEGAEKEKTGKKGK